jgi:hypothetical protein
MGKANTATKEKPGTAVAKTGGSAAVPAHLRGRTSGKGVSQSADDSLVPLIVVLQAQSPQAIKQKPEFLKGAEAGCIWLKNAPQPVIPSEVGILVQPCAFYKNVVEWIPKNKDGSGGGYVGEHKEMPKDAKEVADKDDPERKRMMSPRGTEYVETRNHAVIVYTPDGNAYPYLIPLSSSGHSVSRQWMFMMKSKTYEGHVLDSFTALYRLKTMLRTKGTYNWYTFDPHEGGDEGETLWATDEQVKAGEALAAAFEAGEKKADMASAEPDAPAGAAGPSTASKDKAKSKI